MSFKKKDSVQTVDTLKSKPSSFSVHLKPGRRRRRRVAVPSTSSWVCRRSRNGGQHAVRRGNTAKTSECKCLASRKQSDDGRRTIANNRLEQQARTTGARRWNDGVVTSKRRATSRRTEARNSGNGAGRITSHLDGEHNGHGARKQPFPGAE